MCVLIAELCRISHVETRARIEFRVASARSIRTQAAHTIPKRTQVAQHVLKTVVAARLMGAECIISGIRPQIAQTIVALGIEFGDIATKASLADALRHVLRQKDVKATRRSAGRREG